ncbi:hypothetical protein [Arcanobacterium hippocoleae]|uniref:Fic family protein n=1 Tax=Arcanobacterium hippocoleae TaxID=149017 RepID=A0ABU1T2X9_9ACTO|nr:hypothetical protein [Arcanobacterium hippocoleae]MDR6939708.1 Fic family protein [Arcanobacterium hippocoleae]
MGVSRPTAGKYAQQLVALGIVEQVKIGKSVLFINTNYLSLLFDAKLPQ